MSKNYDDRLDLVKWIELIFLHYNFNIIIKVVESNHDRAKITLSRINHRLANFCGILR